MMKVYLAGIDMAPLVPEIDAGATITPAPVLDVPISYERRSWVIPCR